MDTHTDHLTGTVCYVAMQPFSRHLQTGKSISSTLSLFIRPFLVLMPCVGHSVQGLYRASSLAENKAGRAHLERCFVRLMIDAAVNLKMCTHLLA